ncbi:MAG: hypothetical protein NXI22_03315 [bacterium]|nr:hypothetical protein [bacterium]
MNRSKKNKGGMQRSTKRRLGLIVSGLILIVGGVLSYPFLIFFVQIFPRFMLLGGIFAIVVGAGVLASAFGKIDNKPGFWDD